MSNISNIIKTYEGVSVNPQYNISGISITTNDSYSTTIRMVYDTRRALKLTYLGASYVETLARIKLGDIILDYDYDICSKKDPVNTQNLEILFNHLIKKNSCDETEEIYGHLSIYYLDQLKIKSYSINICNDYICKSGDYLKYYLMFICNLFENNFKDYPVKIVNAVLSVNGPKKVDGEIREVCIIKYSENNENIFENNFKIISEIISEKIGKFYYDTYSSRSSIIDLNDTGSATIYYPSRAHSYGSLGVDETAEWYNAY